MNALTWFGLFAVSLMPICYAMERRSRWWILAFAFSCALGSTYGFLQGAWPFGVVEAIWAAVAVKRFFGATRQDKRLSTFDPIAENKIVPACDSDCDLS
jgi:hypothetical protein